MESLTLVAESFPTISVLEDPEEGIEHSEKETQCLLG